MEERRFDELTRVLGAATTRRQVLKGALGVAFGAVLASVGVRAPRVALAALASCGGVTYDPTTQCCEPAGPQPRYPIANLDLCPNRVPHPGHVPEFNGCGPANGVVSHLIPNRIGPFRNIDFTPACNNHDVCYDTCNSVKSTCDHNFLTDMRAACAQAYPGRGFFDRYMRAGCQADAYVYYTAVSRGGADAYESAQKQACDCCGVCEECGGSDDERCCHDVCHDPCEEGQKRDPETCSCDPCFGKDDGTDCGTNQVCCQQGCVNDQCASGKSFDYGSCACVCEPVECPDGEHQDPDTCQCVNDCTNVTCDPCQTCDPASGACVPAMDGSACGDDQVCCGGACCTSYESCCQGTCQNSSLGCCDDHVQVCYGPNGPTGQCCPAGQGCTQEVDDSYIPVCCPLMGSDGPFPGSPYPALPGGTCCSGSDYLAVLCSGSISEGTWVCCGYNQDCCGQ